MTTSQPLHTDKSDTVSLNEIVARWMRWYRIRRSLEWTGYGLIIGLACGLIGGVIAIPAGWLIRNEFLLFTGACALTSILVASIAGYFWAASPRKTAIYFDRVFGLQERLSTALELSDKSETIGTHEELVFQQLADTLRQAEIVEVRRQLPLHIRRLNILVSLTLILSILIISWRAEPLFTFAANQRRVEQAITDQIAALETLQTELEQNEQLTLGDREELIQALDQAVTQLNDTQTVEEAVSILADTQAQLESLADTQAQEQAQALQDAGSSLSQQADSPLGSIGEQLSTGDLANAAQELSEIDPSTLTEDERQEMADQLNETAQALESTNPELADSLNQAAEALRNGDDQAAQEALSEAGETIRQTGQQAAQETAAQDAAAQVAQGQQQVLQAGHAADSQSSEGSSQGEGTSQQPGQGSSTSGAGRGEGDNADNQGSEAGDDPISQDNSPGDGGESLYQPIYPPEHLGGVSDDLLTLPTSPETGEIILGEGDVAPGTQNRTTVPYTQVYTIYSQVYRQAVENGDIPPYLRNMVRDYFSSIAP